jgi:hypothetical protein
MRVAPSRKPLAGFAIISTAPAIDHRQFCAGRSVIRLVRIDAGHSRQIVAGWVRAPADHRAIEQDERETFVPVLPERFLDDLVCRKCLGLLRQVVPLDGDALVRQPMQIGGESNQGRINVGTAYAGRAAHWGIEHFYFSHDLFPSVIV